MSLVFHLIVPDQSHQKVVGVGQVPKRGVVVVLLSNEFRKSIVANDREAKDAAGA